MIPLLILRWFFRFERGQWLDGEQAVQFFIVQQIGGESENVGRAPKQQGARVVASPAQLLLVGNPTFSSAQVTFLCDGRRVRELREVRRISDDVDVPDFGQSKQLVAGARVAKRQIDFLTQYQV